MSSHNPAWGYEQAWLAATCAELGSEISAACLAKPVDVADLQRVTSCPSISPTNPEIFRTPGDRGRLLINAVAELFFGHRNDDDFLLEISDHKSVRKALARTELSVVSSFYLEVELAELGSRKFSQLLSRTLGILRGTLGTSNFAPCIQSGLETSLRPIAGSHIAVKRQDVQSGNLIAPADLLVFVSVGTDPCSPPRERALPPMRSPLLELEVDLSLVEHLLETGVPARALMVVDLWTGENWEHPVEPDDVERAISRVRHALSHRRSEALQTRKGGPWCVACHKRETCSESPPAQQFRRDDEEDLF